MTLEIIVLLSLVFLACAYLHLPCDPQVGAGTVADQRHPKKVKQEWRPSEEMYVVNDEFNVTHWLGTDVEIAKMYMEPGWKLGKGSPKGWKWETYETIYPYSSKYGGPHLDPRDAVDLDDPPLHLFSSKSPPTCKYCSRRAAYGHYCPIHAGLI
jgi:hypothetical protein